eukprot:SAG31_NODE_1644_length_7652_cov_2.702502_8_plen_98_part_00
MVLHDSKQEWWFSVGSQLAERISVAERARKCGSKLTDADRAGYTISVRECITVLASRTFDTLRSKVVVGKLSEAIGIITANDDNARLLLRGALYVRS